MPTATDSFNSDIDLNYVDQTSGSCTLRRVWTAVDGAGNSASRVQIITFTNPRPPQIIASNLVLIPCGSVEDAIQDIGRASLNVTHPCGRPVTTTFVDSTIVNMCGFDFTRTWSIQDDCGSRSTFLQTIRVLPQQLPDSPANGQLNVRLDEPLLWPQFPSATRYKVYVWMLGTERPQEPTATVSRRQYRPSTSYPQATRLLWQIEYVIGENMTIPSPVWGFETQSLPDLAVTNIEVPPVAFSGQQFDVSWNVINVGNLSVSFSNIWYDSLYIGPTTDFSLSRRTQQVRQRRFVDPQDGYVSQATIDLFPYEVGTFYVFVVVDSSYRVCLCRYVAMAMIQYNTVKLVYSYMQLYLVLYFIQYKSLG